MHMQMPRKKTNKRRATETGAVVGGLGGLGAYLAGIASVKWGVPVELTAPVVVPAVGFVSALVSRWAAKLLPDV